MIYIEGVPEKKVPCDIFRQRYDKPGNGQYHIRFRYLPEETSQLYSERNELSKKGRCDPR